MAQSTTLDESDVVAMDTDELKRTSSEIDVDPEALADAFPSFEHHMTVKAKLRTLARKGVITSAEMEQILSRWDESR